MIMRPNWLKKKEKRFNYSPNKNIYKGTSYTDNGCHAGESCVVSRVLLRNHQNHDWRPINGIKTYRDSY